MSRNYRVPCFENGTAVGMVKYTNNLDQWDGNNWCEDGNSFKHLGVGKTEDGKFYACHGTEYTDEAETAEIISETEAKNLVMRHDYTRYEVLFGETPPEL